MIAENFLQKLGFTPEMQENYVKYAAIYADRQESWVTGYMSGQLTLEEAVAGVRSIEPKICTHTADLMLILGCTGPLWERYCEAGLPESMFLDSMADILCKVRECEKVHGCFGTFVVGWFNGFFRMTRFTFGRLEFDVSTVPSPVPAVDGFTPEEGDFLLHCHIPSRGPLLHEDCLKSYRMAWEFFSDRLKGGILPIHCGSWLLYPPYREVFGEGSNILEFAKDFRVYQEKQTDVFDDAWRVFSRDYTGDLSVLPADTRLQRSFRSYIQNGGSFGVGRGVLLFDGETVLTRE